MQQVKKQLQDAIAELKSGWGINEVKREDLAAVLDKVVAALDRAAQLPVAPEPAGEDFDLCFLRVDVIAFGAEISVIQNSDAPEGCTPAVRITQSGSMVIEVGFFYPLYREFYTTDSEGRTFWEVQNGRFLYNDKRVFIPKRVESNLVAFGVDGNSLSGYYEANIV